MFSAKMLRLVITAYFVLMTQFAFFQFSVYPKSQAGLDTAALSYHHNNSIDISRLLGNSLPSDEVEIVKFDHNKHWLVFFHIQKTSGTNFDLSIVRGLLISHKSNQWKRACEMNEVPVSTSQNSVVRRFTLAYTCKRDDKLSSWYLSWHEQSFGWPCGLHPTLSDLKTCIDAKYNPDQSLAHDKHFFYVSMIREPVSRYISEYHHVRNTGSLWIFEQEALTESQKCVKEYASQCLGSNRGSDSWRGVSLDQFMECKWNLAGNRQTWLLAQYDSTFSMCQYLNSSGSVNETLDQELLSRAINGLHSLSFFGLTEYQIESKKLFEKQFDNKFEFSTNTAKFNTATERTLKGLDQATTSRINELNYLDIKLYEYAKGLFFKRLARVGLN